MAVHEKWLELEPKACSRNLRWGFSKVDRHPYREQIVAGKTIRHSRQNDFRKAKNDE